MPQIVTLPNGEEAEFPDEMPDQEIEAILQKQFGAPKKDPTDMFRKQLATAGSFGATPQPEDMPEGAAGKLAMAGTIASLPLGVQAAGAPLAALRGLAMSAAGASAGGYAGSGLGRGLEIVGAPEGTSEAAGTIGGLVGGVAGPVGGPMALAKLLKLGGGKAGMLGQIGERLAGTGAASVEATAAKTAAAAEKEAAKAAEHEAARKLRERALAVAEERNALTRQRLEQRAARETAKAAPKSGPRAVPRPAPAAAPPTEGATALKPEPEFIPDEAVSLVAEPLPFRPRPSKGTTTMATNLGGKAKPGPAATPPDELEATLQASVDANKAKGATRPFKGSMSLEDERRAADQFIPSQLEELATAMPKGEGPGTIPWALGKRPRGPGDIPQVGELASNARAVAKNPDVPPDLAKRLEDFAERASKPTGRLMGREHGRAEPVLPRRSILTEYIDILKDPKWETVFGSDEMLRHATKLDAKLAALRSIEKLMAAK